LIWNQQKELKRCVTTAIAGFERILKKECIVLHDFETLKKYAKTIVQEIDKIKKREREKNEN